MPSTTWRSATAGGVPRDLTQAELWLDRAARQGHSKAAETRATMAARPTSKDDFATALGAVAVGAAIVVAIWSSDEKPDAVGDQGTKRADDCRKQAMIAASKPRQTSPYATWCGIPCVRAPATASASIR